MSDRAPLRPPAAPRDLEERLAASRRRTARALAPVELDPPGHLFDDADADLGGEGVEGLLEVPDHIHHDG